MKYRVIKNKTYNNVMYLAGIISREKGYPIKEAANIALNSFFDFDDTFQWLSVETMLNNLVTFEESKIRKAAHERNMAGLY